MRSQTNVGETAARVPSGTKGSGSPEHGTHARTLAGIQAAVRSARPRGLSVDFLVGSGLDVCANNGGDVLTLSGSFNTPAVTSIDWQKQSAWVAAGASIATVSRELLVQGWALAELGGTARSTVAGALALDMRGPYNRENSSDSVLPRTVEFVDGLGNTRQFRGCESDSPAVTALVAAFGLTGVCTEVELPLRPVSTGWMLVDSKRCETSDEVFAELLAAPAGTHALARIDPTGQGSGVGRGIAVSGRYARVAELPDVRQANALEYVECTAGRTAARVPMRLRSTAAKRLFKGLTHRTAAAQRQAELVPMATFFHGDSEMRAHSREVAQTITYEFTVPLTARDLIPAFLDRLSRLKVVGQSANIQRRGPRGTGPLGVSVDGWTLTTELDTDVPGLGRVLDDWDEKVAQQGGQVSLATDTRIRGDLIAAMYPELAKWRELRTYLDPAGRFSSNLARRLSL